MGVDVERRKTLGLIGAAGIVGLAGCTDSALEDTEEFNSGAPTEDEDGGKPSYIPLDFLEAERDLEDHRGQFVAVEGWLRYRDNEQWWAFDPDDDGGETHTRMLETYDLFPDDPGEYDDLDEAMASITVVDDGSLHTLPRSAVLFRESYQARIHGEAAIIHPDLGMGDEDGKQYSQQHGEAAIKAHGYELLDGA